ncbi:hypothetical protein BOX15_Mlig012381g3, partial [Macrostomum lignano]
LAMSESSCFVAEFAYDATESDELTIEPGDIILDAQPANDDGWMTGRKESSGKSGLFPDNFVVECSKAALKVPHQRIPAGASVFVAKRGDQQSTVYAGKQYGGRVVVPNSCLDFSGKAAAAHAANPSGGVGPKQRANHIVGGVGLGNIFAGEPITLKRAEDQRAGVGKPAAPPPQQPQQPEDLVQVQFKYEATSRDELSLEPGQIVRVLSRQVEDEGWWRGEIDGRIGVFPDNFVVPYKPPVPPPAAAVRPAPANLVERPLPPQPAVKPSPPPPTPPKVGIKPGLRPVADPARNGPDVAEPKRLPPAVPQPADSVSMSVDYQEQQQRLRDEIEQLKQQDEERRRELQDLQRFKRTAQQDIALLKEDLDQMSKKYMAVTVDLDRLKKDLQALAAK